MVTKSRDWGKILLTIGLLLVAAYGICMLPPIKRWLIPDGPITREITLAGKAYLKIKKHFKIHNELVRDISLLPDMVNGRETEGPLAWPLFPVSKLGPRFFPSFCLKIEFRLAKQQRVNVARKMEDIDIILASIERKTKLRQGEDQTKIRNGLPHDIELEIKLEEVNMIRRNLDIIRLELQNLSDIIDTVKLNDGK